MSACGWLGNRISKIYLTFFTLLRIEVRLRMCGTILLHPNTRLYGADSENFTFLHFLLYFYLGTLSFKCVLQASCFYQNKIFSVGSAANIATRSPWTTVNFTCSFTSKSFSDLQLCALFCSISPHSWIFSLRHAVVAILDCFSVQ